VKLFADDSLGPKKYPPDRAATFSIVGRCHRTGQFGIAVSTAVPAVGMLVPYARANVGAVATQSFLNPYLAIWGLEMLAAGRPADKVVEALVDRDPAPAKRQVAVVDRWGGSAAYSGIECDTWYGHVTGPDFAVAGNMLTGQGTVAAMAEEFETRAEADLPDRLLRALEAGQRAGGDKRGKESAALLVVHTEDYPFLDLRVDYHHDPVAELRRVYTVALKRLLPLIRMMPTKGNPRGSWQ
jgi:uncharacterized Ntn-hydrolase superfamily protein